MPTNALTPYSMVPNTKTVDEGNGVYGVTLNADAVLNDDPALTGVSSKTLSGGVTATGDSYGNVKLEGTRSQFIQSGFSGSALNLLGVGAAPAGSETPTINVEAGEFGALGSIGGGSTAALASSTAGAASFNGAAAGGAAQPNAMTGASNGAPGVSASAASVGTTSGAAGASALGSTAAATSNDLSQAEDAAAAAFHTKTQRPSDDTARDAFKAAYKNALNTYQTVNNVDRNTAVAGLGRDLLSRLSDPRDRSNMQSWTSYELQP